MLATSVSAATFSLTGGTAGFIPEGNQTNEVLTNVFGMPAASGEFGATVNLDAATDTQITVNYFGFEAGFANSFVIDGVVDSVALSTELENGNGGVYTLSSDYATDLSSPLSSSDLVVAAGQLSFSFSTAGGGGIAQQTVENGSNTDNTASNPAIANFFASLSRDAQTVFLFFDDTGAGDDDNHDDFVVSLSISGINPQEPQPVPLPAGGLLLLGGLGAFAVARRRKTKS